MKYNEDIRAELEAIRTDANAKLDLLNEFERNGEKYKAADATALKASISSDPEWNGKTRPAPVAAEV